MTDPKTPSKRDEQQEREKWYERTRYQVLLFAAGIALFGVVLGLILDWYIAPKTSTQKKDLVQALGLITAGVAGAVGIYFTWRGQRLARKAQEDNQRSTLAQLEQSRNELDIARRGQITERFTKAIDQLGSENLEITLGGIYSLERTAQEDRDYHWPIMEVLTTYVRTHAPRKPGEEVDDIHVPELEIQAHLPEPEIQAILTIIGRRFVDYRDVEYGPIDLNVTDLGRADLREANLQRALFLRANLQVADLREADLQGAILYRANLQGANLQGANLSGANLMEANLQRARFREALLPAANLQEANVGEADLRRADLRGANLRGADFLDAILQGADLQLANLQPANLIGANLQGANFREANLQGAYLQNAMLIGANLQGANLQGADGLAQYQLRSVFGSKGTTLPQGLYEPTAWSRDLEEQRMILQKKA